MVRSAWIRLLGTCGPVIVGAALLLPSAVWGAQVVRPVPTPVAAHGDPLERQARLSIAGVTLDEALQALGTTSGTTIIYSPTRLPDRKVACACGDRTVRDVLDHLLRGTRLRFGQVGKSIVIEPVERERIAHPSLSLYRPSLTPSYLNGGSDMYRTFGSSIGRALAGAAAGLVLSAVSVAAQTGTIAGQVTDSQTGQPVAAAQVFIPSLSLGVLTQQNGRYTLANVPPGSHEVTVQRIGFRDMTQSVAVTSGESATLNFQITQGALQLDQIIVTGTPGGTQRRAIGNAVSRVDAGSVAQVRPVNDMQQLLSSRVPGLSFARSTGNLGTGSQMVIRGISSFTLGSQPLIYVDGVRMDNATNLGPSLPNLSAAREVSALDDLNPNDIESIEIIKGPAAATLYGTEASAGVIQIITKKGSSGAAQFDIGVNTGLNFIMNAEEIIGDQFARDPQSGEIYRFNIFEEERKKGFGSPLQSGLSQGYSLGIRGGTDLVTYFISADWTNQEGAVDYNVVRRFNTRTNLGVFLTDDLKADVSLGIASGNTSFASGTQGVGGLWPALMWAQGNTLDTPLRGYLQHTPEELATVEATRENSRVTASVTLSYNPVEWLSQRLIAGMDRGEETSQVLFPRHPLGADGPFRAQSLGDVTISRPVNTELTLDYSTSGRFRLNETLSFTTSVGAQYYASKLDRLDSYGAIFSSPVIRSIAGATETRSTQAFIEEKALGLYVQQEASINDRIFLTAALRGDGSSAFGSNFRAAYYPKASATWVMSDEPFWRLDWVDAFRIRTAWGKAGRQPGTFAAITRFASSVGPGGAPAITPQTLGNPDLGPEVGTELELGFDISLFADRIAGEFTYYSQRVENALANVPLSPSHAFPGTQSDNLGRLDVRGWEASLRTRAVQRGSWSLDLGAAGSFTANEVKELGVPETNSLRVGFPYPAVVTYFVESAEFDDAGRVVNVMCDQGTPDRRPGGEIAPCVQGQTNQLLLGTPFPKYTVNLDGTLTLFNDLQVFGMVDGEFGRIGRDYNINCRQAACFLNSEKSLRRDDPLYVIANSGPYPTDVRYQDQFDAAFLKLRELGVRYQIPSSRIQRFGAERASVSISARDLWYLWRAQEQIQGINIPSPETRDPNSTSNFSLYQWPGLTSVSASLRVSF